MELFNNILELIFPPTCAICGKLSENYLCKDCNERISKIEKWHINKYQDKPYNMHMYLFKYKDIRNEILDYKFNDKSYYYKTFENILIKNKKMCEIIKSYDIIIPVPIHNKRRKQRGYNQTELIARDIAKELELQYKNILQKNKNTLPQSSLNKAQRIENAKNIYTLKKCNIENKKVLIFDDIYTTGSTAEECAKEVQKEKPKEIGILTLAKD